MVSSIDYYDEDGELVHQWNRDREMEDNINKEKQDEENNRKAIKESTVCE